MLCWEVSLPLIFCKYLHEIVIVSLGVWWHSLIFYLQIRRELHFLGLDFKYRLMLNLPYFMFKLGCTVSHIIRPFTCILSFSPFKLLCYLLIHFTFTYAINKTMHCYFCFKPTFLKRLKTQEKSKYIYPQSYDLKSLLSLWDPVFHLVPFCFHLKHYLEHL